MTGADAQAAVQSVGDQRGVRFAALFGTDGSVLATAGDHGAEDPAGLLTPARAIVDTLAQTLGSEGWNDLILDFESGPVLLTPSADGARMLVVGFDELSSLGRVRLAVKRVLD